MIQGPCNSRYHPIWTGPYFVLLVKRTALLLDLSALRLIIDAGYANKRRLDKAVIHQETALSKRYH